MIKYLKKVSITLILGLCFLNNTFAQKQPYEIIVYVNNFTSFKGDNYEFITFFLNNNTNDTLYYKGADCYLKGYPYHLFTDANCYNYLFSLKPNPYFHLADNVCTVATNSKLALPPHRSQKMNVCLQVDKQTDQKVLLSFKLNWNEMISKNYIQQNLDTTSFQSLFNISLKGDSDHHSFKLTDDSEEFVQKELRTLPNKDMYLLTDNDRKLYTLTINEETITKSHDTMVTVFPKYKLKKCKYINVPLMLQNNSDDTLKIYYLPCSRPNFYKTNNQSMNVLSVDCFLTPTIIIKVNPHGEYQEHLPVIYDAKLKSGTKYKISMCLIKVLNNQNYNSDLLQYKEQYTMFNKIWSNEVTIKD